MAEQKPPPLYLNDNWTPKVEDLGYDNLRDELVELAVRAQPPFATAIYGSWGSGKTSLMRSIYMKLGGKLLRVAPDDTLMADAYEVGAEERSYWEEQEKKHEKAQQNAEKKRKQAQLKRDDSLKKEAELNKLYWRYFKKPTDVEVDTLQAQINQVEEEARQAEEAAKKLEAEAAGLAEKKQVPNNFHCIWFNPWQYQNEAHPMIALLQEIRQQYSIRLKMMDSAKKIGHVALKTGLRLIGDLISSATKAVTGHAVKVDPDQIEKTGLTYEQNHFMQTLDSQRFQIHFESAIAHLVGGEKPEETGRLVIFIDDLDRCESGPALKLLECIKLYLSTRKCLFFFGLDTEHTEKALVKEGLGTRLDAKAYLHKLFQLSVHLPRSNAFDTFIDSRLALLKADRLFEKTEGLGSFLSEILEGNPRRIKNFLNQLLVRGRLFNKRFGEKADPRLLALLLALRHYFPEVYTSLEAAPNELNKITEGLRVERPKNATHGTQATVARLTYLPQVEPAPIGEGTDEKDTLGALAGDHYADVHGLFWVLERFKAEFSETFEPLADEEELLKRYLAP